MTLRTAIFVSAMFFFSLAAGRAETTDDHHVAYLLTFVVRGDTGTISYVTVPGIATQAECDRLATEMLTRPDRLYACHAYQAAH
jgi:hypothetical protein